MADISLESAIPSVINAGFAAAESRKERNFAREMYQTQLADQWDFTHNAQAYNTDEREAAQDWEFAMWNRTNQYNSPSAQVARMMQAGINPNSAISGMSGVNVASSPNTAGATSPASSVPSLTGHQVFAPQVSELGLIASQIGLNEANTQGQRIENEHKDEILDWTAENLRAAVSKAESDVNLNAALRSLNEENANRIRKMLPLEIATSDQELENLKEALKQISANTTLLKYKSDTERENRKNVAADTALKGAQTSLAGEQLNTELAKQNELDSQTDLNEASADVKGEEYAKEVWTNTMRSNGVDPTSPVSVNAYNNVLLHSNSPEERAKIIGGIQQSISTAQNVRATRRAAAKNRRFRRSRLNPR